MGQDKAAEAEKSLRQALTHYEKLEASFPAYKDHKEDHESAQQSLTQLLAFKPFLEDAAETQEGRRLQAAGQHRAVIEVYRQALGRHEQQRKEFADQSTYLHLLAVKQNRLAWILVTSSDERVRDPKQAVELAGKAVENAPQQGAFSNTLGAAHFRAGNWDQCVRALETSMKLRQEGDGFDWLFLAMAYHQLGKAVEANKWLDKALDWIAQMEQGKFTNPLVRMQWQAHRREAEMVRREAEELIRPKPAGDK
jgi:tetratricopeptide (TPR) repeat protein